jgi:hypothetical protein
MGYNKEILKHMRNQDDDIVKEVTTCRKRWKKQCRYELVKTGGRRQHEILYLLHELLEETEVTLEIEF